MTPRGSRKTTPRVRDLVQQRNSLRHLKRLLAPKTTQEVDTVASVWNDPYGLGRMVLTENGHIVESQKGIGETITLLVRGGCYTEAS